MPVNPRFFSTDCTEQRLSQLIEERGGAYAVLSGEGRPVIDSILGKYSGGGYTGDSIYLAGISGDTITRDRVGGKNDQPEERIIKDPCLNVCVMVQPDKYLEMARTPALRHSGQMARILAFRVPSLVGTRIEEPGETGLAKDCFYLYESLIEEILNVQDSGVPHRAILSKEAAEQRRILNNTIEAQMATDKDFEDVRDFASKLVSNIAKIAIVIHVAEKPEIIKQSESVISPKTWAVAQSLGSFYFQEAIKNQRQADENRLISEAKRVIGWIIRQGEQCITATELTRIGPRPRPQNVKDATELLGVLEEYGYLRSEIPSGKRKPIYNVNPYIAKIANIAKGRKKIKNG